MLSGPSASYLGLGRLVLWVALEQSPKFRVAFCEVAKGIVSLGLTIQGLRMRFGDLAIESGGVDQGLRWTIELQVGERAVQIGHLLLLESRCCLDREGVAKRISETYNSLGDIRNHLHAVGCCVLLLTHAFVAIHPVKISVVGQTVRHAAIHADFPLLWDPFIPFAQPNDITWMVDFQSARLVDGERLLDDSD